MRKFVSYLLLIIIGFLSPELVKSIQAIGETASHVDNSVNEDSVRALFCRNPTIENHDLLWEPLVYQGNTLRKYDLFIYMWYTGINDSIYSSRYTLHRMLTDTIYDKNHFIPNSTTSEFANKFIHLSTKGIKDENNVD